MLKLVTKKKADAENIEKRRKELIVKEKIALFKELEKRLDAANSFTLVSHEANAIFFDHFRFLYQTLVKGVDDYYFTEIFERQETPLTQAVKLTNFKLLKWMLEQDRFEVEISNADNKTPLELAVQNVNWKIIDLLFEHGACVTTDAIQHAIRIQNVTMLTKLLRKDSHDSESYSSNLIPYITLIVMALQTRNPRVLGAFHREVNCSQLILWLVKHAWYILENPETPTDKKFSDCCARLQQVLQESGPDTVPNLLQTLVNLGVDVNAVDAYENCSALWFIREPREAAILLDAGADKHFTSQNVTLLGNCAIFGQAQMVQFWASRGLAVDQVVDNEGNTPLLAVAKKFTETCITARVLIEEGANVNVVNEKGETALLLALRTGNRELAKFLLQNNACAYAADKRGNTPLLESMRMSRKKFPEDEQLARELIEKCANVGTMDAATQKTILMYVASEEYSVQLMKLVIDRGANIEARDAKKKSVLSYAAKGAKKDLIKALLARKKAQHDAEEAAAIAKKAAEKAVEAAQKVKEVYANVDNEPARKKQKS